MIDVKILGPYEIISPLSMLTVMSRKQLGLDNPYRFYVLKDVRSKEWHSIQFRGYRQPCIFQSLELAKEALDKLCIEHGYKLLNTQDEVDKYRLLI